MGSFFRELWRLTWPELMLMKPATTVAILVFILVAMAHLHRVIFGWEVLVNGKLVPIWTSVVGVILSGCLAALLVHETWRGGK